MQCRDPVEGLEQQYRLLYCAEQQPAQVKLIGRFCPQGFLQVPGSVDYPSRLDTGENRSATGCCSEKQQAVFLVFEHLELEEVSGSQREYSG